MIKNDKSINGAELRDFRKSMGWSQGELAEMLNVSSGLISHYECGRLHTPRKFSVSELEELCKSIATEKVPNKPRAKYTRKKKYVAGQILPDGGVVSTEGTVLYPNGKGEVIRVVDWEKCQKTVKSSYTLQSIKSMIFNKMANAVENNKLDDLIKLCNSYNLLK